MRNSSAAKSEASSPPVPARISTITFFSSLGSLGISRHLQFAFDGRQLGFEFALLVVRHLLHFGFSRFREQLLCAFQSGSISFHSRYLATIMPRSE